MKRGKPSPGVVLGAVIHHDELPVWVSLSTHRLDGFLEESQAVSCWDYDGYDRLSHGGFPKHALGAPQRQGLPTRTGAEWRGRVLLVWEIAPSGWSETGQRGGGMSVGSRRDGIGFSQGARGVGPPRCGGAKARPRGGRSQHLPHLGAAAPILPRLRRLVPCHQNGQRVGVLPGLLPYLHSRLAEPVVPRLQSPVPSPQ